MLKEIYCEEFKENGIVRPSIKLNNGLNIITGETTTENDSGNSLGKSTFLQIIDFVFGGDFYCKKANVTKLVGQHTIFFTFEFDGEPFYFCRKTSDKTHVYKCNIKREIEKSLTNKEYTSFLAEKYKIDNTNLSFREYVSPFFRIYKKSPGTPDRTIKRFFR